MKIKNIASGDFVQIKKSMCHSEFKAKQVCEVIDIDLTGRHSFDVLIRGKNCLDWVSHKDLKEHVKRELEPLPKQLDQSVFDGLDEKWRFAAIDGATSRAYVYEQKPQFFYGGDFWRVHNGLQRVVGKGYDASNWQNSLIERDIAEELTGSELCKAMLARGDKYISGFGHHYSDTLALQSKFADTVSKHTQCFQSSQNSWDYFVPINNQGEPLTASDVGL